MKLQLSTALAVILFVLPSIVSAQQVAPEKVIVRDGVELHYVDRGKGEPIIFVHGLSGDYSVWLRQADAFVKKGYRTITYSRRYNYPNNNKLQDHHSAVVEAEDLAAFMRKLNLNSAHIAGYSYGAYTSLFLALKHPALVRTLTLSEPPIVPWLDNIPGEKAESARAHKRRLLGEGIEPAKAALQSGNDELAMRTLFNCISGKNAFEKLPPFVQQRCRRNINEFKAIVSSKDRYPDVDRAQVRRLKTPVLILSGGNSTAVARYTDSELERLLPAATTTRVVLKNATHIMWVQQPVQSRRAVLEFIRGK